MTQKISYNADGELRLEDDVETTKRKLAALVKGTYSDHNLRHQAGGDDDIKLDDLATPDDNTDLDASNILHGLMPKTFIDGWMPAGETWTFAANDDPTYTFTIAAFNATTKYSAGMRVKLTDTGTQYGIITKVIFDDPGSTITIYMGTDYDLSGGAITNPYYSTQKTPLSFPLDPDKWTIEVTDTVSRSELPPTQNIWYNLGSISIDIPIGAWDVNYQVCLKVRDFAIATEIGVKGTLSTANNSESDSEWTTYISILTSTSDNDNLSSTVYRRKIINIATKDTYYLNAMTPQAGIADIWFTNDLTPLIIRAVCAYL